MQTISNISAIVTCILFILYIIGRIWKAVVTMQSKYEKFQVQPLETNDIEKFDNIIRINEVGQIFSLSSIYGIRNINIYEVLYDLNKSGNDLLKSKKLLKTYKNLNVNEELYIQADLGEYVPRIQFEIERVDYTKVKFDLTTSGRTGNIITDNFISKNYGFNMTFKSLLYYLCV